mmetsp:Transcript_29800/g.101319  ORF Transcript_29800/g.101319 Transcript_29800/m.101319 type:complete len:311 (-) Transcript_29800:544-1476(-)
MFREYVQGVFRVVCSEVDVRDGLGDRVGRVREPRVEDEEARAGAERGDADAAAREDLLRLRVAVVAVAPREEAGQQAEEERVRDAARHREQRQEDVAAREREQERRREGPGRVERVVVLAVAADLLALAHGGADEGRRHGGHGEDGEGRRRRGPQVLGEPARRVDELARGRAAAAAAEHGRREGHVGEERRRGPEDDGLADLRAVAVEALGDDGHDVLEDERAHEHGRRGRERAPELLRRRALEQVADVHGRRRDGEERGERARHDDDERVVRRLHDGGERDERGRERRVGDARRDEVVVPEGREERVSS